MSTLSKASSKRLAKRLPQGWTALALEALGEEKYSKQYVSMVKRGKRANAQILRVLLELADAEDARKLELSAVARGDKRVADSPAFTT